MFHNRVAAATLAVVGMSLASACDNADAPSALRNATSADDVAPHAAVIAAAPAGPGPMTTTIATTVCVDVPGAVRTAGTSVITYTCNGGPNQQWALQPSGAITVYDGALCLDVAGGAGNNGDPVVVWSCNGQANQKWTRTAAGELTGVNGKCLDIGLASGGTKLIVNRCNRSANQKWIVRDAAAPTAAPVVVTVPITPAQAPSGTVGSAELPRVYLNTVMPIATGQTISVASGGDLQAALNAAQPGDQVVLAPGASYVGNFVLPAKAGMTAGQWITVRTAGVLPAEGTRVGPSDAGQMPKILTPNVSPAIATAPGTQGWRITGVEVSAVPTSPWIYYLVGFGDGTQANQNTLAQVPSRLVLDRSYVHGSATLDVRRCVALNSASSAVIDSYIADCHSNQGDSQAIYGWNGPGPFKITNNHLEAGHEVAGFGGPTPGVAGLIPSDIEVRGNHLTRPMAWRGVWRVKNLWECKSCQRVLIEGNVLENNWVDAQNGFAVLLQGLTDENNAPQNRVWDVTIRNNIIRNTPSGVSLLSRVSYNGGPLPTDPMRRVTVYNNVVSLNDALGGQSRAVLLQADLRDVAIAQNTFVDPSGALLNAGVMFDDGSNLGPMVNLQITNNVFGPSQWSPVLGNGTVGGTTTLARFAPGGVMTGDLFVNASASQFPAGNYFAGSLAEAGFTGISSGNMSLQSGTSFAAQYLTVPGAITSIVTTATSGAVR